uniref:Uncharacterized protein n=1 Tax=Panulirus argus virus 1 TaxID=380624 RepID=A0A6G9HDR7_9VIRU|nr:hypothetical protein [Panulirus argus virus 1]
MQVATNDVVKCKLILENLGVELSKLVLSKRDALDSPIDIPTSMELELELKRLFCRFVSDIYQCLELDNKDLVKLLIDNINGEHPRMVAPQQASRRFNFFDGFEDGYEGGGGSGGGGGDAEDDRYWIEYLDKDRVVGFYRDTLQQVFSPDNVIWKLRFKDFNKTKFITTRGMSLIVPKLTIVLLIIAQNTMLILKEISSVDSTYRARDNKTMDDIAVGLYAIFNSFEYGRKNKKLFSDSVRPDLLSAFL